MTWIQSNFHSTRQYPLGEQGDPLFNCHVCPTQVVSLQSTPVQQTVQCKFYRTLAQCTPWDYTADFLIRNTVKRHESALVNPVLCL